MGALAGNTHLKEVPDYIRSSVSVMSDLLDATGRNLKIVFRDDASGREWQYSPLEPGKAVPIGPDEGEPDAGNVYRPSFGRRCPNEMIVGERAFVAETNGEVGKPSEPVSINGRRQKGR
jgi:hypothetical protein